jgi:hypothetical protein
MKAGRFRPGTVLKASVTLLGDEQQSALVRTFVMGERRPVQYREVVDRSVAAPSDSVRSAAAAMQSALEG